MQTSVAGLLLVELLDAATGQPMPGFDRLAADPLYERTLKSIPFGRMGTAEEIAEVALFLASPHARWITGQTIAVDGGQLLGV